MQTGSRDRVTLWLIAACAFLLGASGHAVWTRGQDGPIKAVDDDTTRVARCAAGGSHSVVQTSAAEPPEYETAEAAPTPGADEDMPAPYRSDAGAARPAANLPMPASVRLERLAGLVDRHDERGQEMLAHELQALAGGVSTDPDLRRRVLDRFMQTAGTEEGAILASTLGTVEDEDVETSLLGLAATAAEPARRIAALEALSQSARLSLATRGSLMKMLAAGGEDDANVTVAALSALGKRGATSVSEQASVVETIKPLLRNVEPRVREQSLRALTEWAPNDETVRQAVLAAASDPDAAVRGSAVQMLGSNGFRFEDVRNVLIARLQDPQEDPQVRLSAWQALEAYPLDDQAYVAYSTFKSIGASDAVNQPATN